MDKIKVEPLWKDKFAPDCPLCKAWRVINAKDKPCWRCKDDPEEAKKINETMEIIAAGLKGEIQ